MQLYRSERELLEALMVDVAVIKEKLSVLDKMGCAMANWQDECRANHRELDQAEKERCRSHEARFSALEAAHEISKAVLKAQDTWSARQKAVFWSAVVGVATFAQVITSVIFNLISK
jgi:hypothetical protein